MKIQAVGCVLALASVLAGCGADAGLVSSDPATEEVGENQEPLSNFVNL